MMLRNSTLLFHLLLLTTMRVCLINGEGDHVNGSGSNLQTTTSSVNGATEPNDRSNIDAVPPDQATDPNAKPASKWSLRSILSSLPDWKTVKRKLTPNWSKVKPGLKKIVPDWNKWKGRYSSCFNKPPRNFEGTLKVKKVSLITFHVLMDKHLFEGTANPYGFHIRHFDVRRHILASTHIKLPKEGKQATSIKLMRIFERFLRECVEPLLILYQKRLDIQRGKELSKSNAATSTSEAPLLVSKGKRKFRLPKISMPNFLPRRNRKNKEEKKSDEPSQEVENKSSETANQANSAESAATERQDSQTPKPAPEPKPKVPMKQKIAEKSKKVAGQVGNGLLKGVKVGLTQGLKYTAKGTGFAIALPFKVAIKGKKIVEEEVIDRVSEKMIDKGWKRAPEERILKPLSYPQKAFLYRLLVWLNKMVFIDDFNPCSIAKEKLRYILVTFSLNVLDPEQGYLKSKYRSYDCVPSSAEDLEKCKDTQNDLMVEHLLKISTKYERSVEQNETENYLDYPTSADRFAIIYFIDAFHDEKYVEFFKMTPNMAKKIIRRQFYHKKMKEKEEQILQRRLEREKRKLIKRMLRDGLLKPDPITGEVVLPENQSTPTGTGTFLAQETGENLHTANSGILRAQNQPMDDGTQKLMVDGKKEEQKTNLSGIWYYLSYLNPVPLVQWTVNSIRSCTAKKTTDNQTQQNQHVETTTPAVQGAPS